MSDPAQPLALCPKCAQEDKGTWSLRSEATDLRHRVWAARASILSPCPALASPPWMEVEKFERESFSSSASPALGA